MKADPSEYHFHSWISLPYATGQCSLCGTMFATGATFQHIPSGELRPIGWVCADKLLFAYPKAAKRQAKAAREKMKDDTRRRKALLEFARSASPELLLSLREPNTFSQKMRKRVMRHPEWGLSDRQQEVLLEIVSKKGKDTKKFLKKVRVPDTGRHQVTGYVQSIRVYDDFYSWGGGTVVKMLVKVPTTDGYWTAFGSCPSSLPAEEGDTIKFTASFVRDTSDESHAKFKRPSKSSILETLEEN